MTKQQALETLAIALDAYAKLAVKYETLVEVTLRPPVHAGTVTMTSINGELLRDPQLTMQQAAAKLEGERDDEELPEDAIPVDGVLARIEELYGIGPSVEEMVRRRKIYEQEHSA